MIACVPLRGYMDVNCYLWLEEETKHGFLIDPGAQGYELMQLCQEKGWTIEKILLTHGHFDHIGGIAAIREIADIPVYIHEAGEAYLTNPALNLSCNHGEEIILHGAKHFRDGDFLRLEHHPDWALQVIHTPGHTPDSVLFYDQRQGVAFSGDTIFKQARGNDRFPGGDGKQLLRSIRERILTLPDETVLYSGHSEATTVGAEKVFY